MENEQKKELNFVDSLFVMFKLRQEITKAKAECRAYDNIDTTLRILEITFSTKV